MPTQMPRNGTFACQHRVAQRIDHAGQGFQTRHAIGEGADAGQHDSFSLGGDGRISGDDDLAGRARAPRPRAPRPSRPSADFQSHNRSGRRGTCRLISAKWARHQPICRPGDPDHVMTGTTPAADLQVRQWCGMGQLFGNFPPAKHSRIAFAVLRRVDPPGGQPTSHS